MIVPNYDGVQIVDENGYPTPGFTNILQTLLKNLTQSIGDEGYLIPPISGDDLIALENSFQSETTAVDPNTQTVTVGAQAGTIIFDPTEQNGAILPALNGQLKVLLNDGSFHKITNT